ncbi:A-kinase anchor protein 1, mitochondrial isoform X1 [Phascolarctos cinereus]|uniref:A-kinase anchor protein 1, mitochondrial isoform X1 n=1 Tax=Phascolarctos cinereus TaxID=38626 RepID=A0A6P5KRQ4_PHACI|nr:A-kinase anchor protein 1, mitochondrial isoform X1 [Phascolarctos cinereus]XP_020847578.1 A-kinase anchor protein 1, mitochondrial isoform X1 [Phascolarctos cinereus]XP_020847579.1 A-kinase anchor protein 1, mitochondrial isoform X1 [Phascolarctos cinereus]XP_020847580.1 A-kinase anchor protein 1, mitochondrial isoform X1 [Phascolarctos cinereus]XP_020847581.1 A-kinase anchor protein 1, mitochondrial isoform X1 [Phascolarctos cinereus]
MTIQFRAIFPLALPGVLALIGWWWFFSRKKEHVSSRDRQAGATAKDLRTDTPIEESLLREEVYYTRVVPLPSNGSQPPDKEIVTMGKSSVELVTIPSQPHLVPRKSDSSTTSSGTTDAKLRLSSRKEDSGRLEKAASQQETRSIPKESSLPPLKDALFPHEAIELQKQDSPFSQISGKGWPGHLEVPSEQHGPLEKVKETSGIEGTGDAAMGESVSEEGGLSHDLGSESKNRVPRQDAMMEEEKGKEKGRSQGVRSVQKEECLGKVLNSFIESTQAELSQEEEALAHQVRGSRSGEGYLDGDLVGELKKRSSLEIREDFEQAAMQIISKVILAAKEEVLGKTAGDLKQHNCQPSVSWVEGPVEEESFALGSQKPVLEQNSSDPSRAVIEAPMAAGETVELDIASPPPGPQMEDFTHKQKTYVSCLKNSLVSSAALDGKPKNSAQRISLAACPPQAIIHHSESFEEANIRVEDTSCVTCMSEDNQRAQSVSSSGNCSDSAVTSGLEDSSLESNLSPSNKLLTPPLLERTVSYSNGVLKGESSDLGTEDRWTTETEADQSGGSDVNSMDSVDSGCGLRKTESHPSSQAGTETNKVELTIWEIEVPKHLVGRLIGKQGRYVSFLKQTSGAKIYISTLPYTQNFQICHIEGSQHHVDKALSLIGKKFKELNLTNIYAPPLPSLTLPSLPMTSWLMLPDGVTVEVIVVNQVNAGHMFVQQHTHPTFHALRSLDQQMYLCYSQPGIPTLPTPVEVAVICAAPGVDGAWWRAQVVAYYKESDEVEIRYVDYGGYKRVKTEILRQIRSDFVTLPFQGAEVLLDNVAPLSDEDHFSPEADSAVNEMTRGTPLLAQVTNYNSTGLPLIQLWSMIGDEAVSINRTLVERGLAQWIDSYYTSL